MSESESEGERSSTPDKAVTRLSLPGEIISDIIEQAPVYGLSGAIFAVGMVTGRRALARSGAKMLVTQLLAAMTRATVDRLLPGQDEPAAEERPAKPVSNEPPPEETPADAGKPNRATIATGALMGVAAAAAGGWLLSRLLARKPAADETD